VVVTPERITSPIWTETSGAICNSEMLANAGIVDPRVRNPREAIRRAQAKVWLYPFISPNRDRGAGASEERFF
jgi:hypothetical protein